MEVWKMIKNSIRHAVSNKGRVIRYVGDGEPVLGETLLNWKEVSSHTSDGYRKVGIDLFGKSTNQPVHRLVAEVFLDKPEDDKKLEVNHIDHNRLNNLVENLEWLTHSANIQHASDSGRLCHTDKRGKKISKEDVSEIKRLYEQGGVTHQKLADLYCVSRVLVTRILNNQLWL